MKIIKMIMNNIIKKKIIIIFLLLFKSVLFSQENKIEMYIYQKENDGDINVELKNNTEDIIYIILDTNQIGLLNNVSSEPLLYYIFASVSYSFSEYNKIEYRGQKYIGNRGYGEKEFKTKREYIVKNKKKLYPKEKLIFLIKKEEFKKNKKYKKKKIQGFLTIKYFGEEIVKYIRESNIKDLEIESFFNENIESNTIFIKL